jgi:hypothetical protein
MARRYLEESKTHSSRVTPHLDVKEVIVTTQMCCEDGGCQYDERGLSIPKQVRVLMISVKLILSLALLILACADMVPWDDGTASGGVTSILNSYYVKGAALLSLLTISGLCIVEIVELHRKPNVLYMPAL